MEVNQFTPSIELAKTDSMTEQVQREVVLLERLVKIATITGTILTGLGLVIAGFQYKLSKDVAASQTKLQQESVRLTTLSTRPWIRATSIIEKEGQGAYGPIVVGYRNSGHSPTVITPILFARFYPSALTPEQIAHSLTFNAELSTTEPTGSAVQIVPADSESLDAIRIPKQHMQAIDIEDPDGKFTYGNDAAFYRELEKKVLYVWGAVLYEDGLNQQHEVKFCYEHRPGDGELFACPALNILDEDVPKENSECVAPQPGRLAPITHRPPCKQIN